MIVKSYINQQNFNYLMPFLVSQNYKLVWVRGSTDTLSGDCKFHINSHFWKLKIQFTIDIYKIG